MATDEPTEFASLSEHEWERLNHFWDQLEDGEPEIARGELHALLGKRPGHPDLLVALAALELGDGDARGALEALSGAERSADPALLFHLRAAAHYELAEFAEARAEADRTIAIQPDFAETHDLLSHICDHLGDESQARGHAAYAAALDPEAFPPPLEIDAAEFDRLVESSLKELPDAVRARLQELPVLVEDLPSRQLLSGGSPSMSPDLFGFFDGQNLFEQGPTVIPAGPGVIYLFRKNLLRGCTDRESLAREVRTTVLHEVGHLLGLDEDELSDWGLA